MVGHIDPTFPERPALRWGDYLLWFTLPVTTLYLSFFVLNVIIFAIDEQRHTNTLYIYTIPIHIIYIIYISIAFFVGRRQCIKQFTYGYRFSYLFVACFALYFLVKILAYPVPAVSSRMMAGFIVHIASALAIGFSAGLSASLSRSPEFDALRNSVWAWASIAAYWLSLLAIFLVAYFYSLDDYFIFHKKDAPIIYQISGNYLTMSFFCFLLMLYSHTSLRWDGDPIEASLLLGLLGISSVSLFFIAQLLGSNNATALIVIIGSSIGIYGIVASMRHADRYRAYRTGLMLIVGIGVVILFLTALSGAGPIRLFNFKKFDPLSQAYSRIVDAPEKNARSGGPSKPKAKEKARSTPPKPADSSDGFEIAPQSISSRYSIFSENVWKQLRVAPIFGDIGVDSTVGQPGSYLHSLLSIQTHLGLIGSVLFLAFFLERLVFLYRKSENYVLKIAIVPIVAMAAVATLFTWGPLWFMIGSLYALRPRAGTPATQVASP